MFVDLPPPPVMIVRCVIFCSIVFINLLRWTWMFICYEICVLMYFWKLTKRNKYIHSCWTICLEDVRVFAKCIWFKNLMDSLTYTYANMRTCLILFLLFLHAVCMCSGLSASFLSYVCNILWSVWHIHVPVWEVFNLVFPVLHTVFICYVLSACRAFSSISIICAIAGIFL